MRYMVMCFPANQRVYELATPRVFPTLAAAEAYRLSIVPGWRQPITVAVVRPDDAEDVWFNQHGPDGSFVAGQLGDDPWQAIGALVLRFAEEEEDTT